MLEIAATVLSILYLCGIPVGIPLAIVVIAMSTLNIIILTLKVVEKYKE